MIGTVTSGNGCVLIAKAEFDRLRSIENRAEMKIRQLEETTLDDFGGIGTGDDTADRLAYVKALRWVIGIELGPV